MPFGDVIEKTEHDNDYWLATEGENSRDGNFIRCTSEESRKNRQWEKHLPPSVNKS